MEDVEDGFKSKNGFAMRERVVVRPRGHARIQYLVCEALEQAGFVNAFSTRIGGVSSLPDQSLNLGFLSSDDADNVKKNRQRFLSAVGADDYVLVTARQTHSTERTVIESEQQARRFQAKCDAMTSRLAGTLLAVQTADCLPILIGDPRTGATAAIHAGWRGTAGRIAERTIADLMQRHGVDPRSCVAALGPNACSDCYEVGDDVIELYKKQFGYWRKLLTGVGEGKAHLDVKAANVQQLLFCGFTRDRIYIAPHCTMHEPELFFSYRREAGGKPGRVGRMLAVIGRS